ncbi:hypothetical protein QUH46_24730, partial [Klebsiella grimontii]|uniref:hypothetical protein n=1 Tax=Klebsiella grimontii TaxID=2058152 RepID=UPI0025A1515E
TQPELRFGLFFRRKKMRSGAHISILVALAEQIFIRKKYKSLSIGHLFNHSPTLFVSFHKYK